MFEIQNERTAKENYNGVNLEQKQRLTEKTIGCFKYALKDHKAVPREFGTYEAFFDYSMAVMRLGELEDKIERGVLVERLPDANKVIQCKDCQHFTASLDFCRCWQSVTDEDGFCHWGEPKDLQKEKE